jgi:pimeloyl-ACP methyl ester carboxylesterase
MRNLLLSTAAALMAGTTFAGTVQSAELPKGAAHNIVLVHGAFVDQTSWKPVADILKNKGYNVTLVENPLTSLAADVDATKQALAKQDGRTVLVGHSWGGVVITQAGNDPKVSSMSPRSHPTLANLWRPWPKAVRQPKAARLFVPTRRATFTSTPRYFLRQSRLTFLRRSPNRWQTPSFR